MQISWIDTSLSGAQTVTPKVPLWLLLLDWLWIVSTNTDLNAQIQADDSHAGKDQTSTQNGGVSSLVMTHFAVSIGSSKSLLNYGV
jgi:hypothetical protein